MLMSNRLYISTYEDKVDEGLDLYSKRREYEESKEQKERKEKALEESKKRWGKKWNKINEIVGKVLFKEEEINELFKLYLKELSRTWFNLTAFSGIPERGFKCAEKERGLKFNKVLKRFILKKDDNYREEKQDAFMLAVVLALKDKEEA